MLDLQITISLPLGEVWLWAETWVESSTSVGFVNGTPAGSSNETCPSLLVAADQELRLNLDVKEGPF